jgi:cytidyltransferase-like protein
MTVGICSGYFQRFHKGHIEYIQSALNLFDHVVVIINNDIQQRNKYSEYENIRSSEDIKFDIMKQFSGGFPRIITSIDIDDSVCETLKLIKSLYPKCRLYFCKDADRNKKNIPETKILREYRIKYIHFLHPKLDSATEIMKREGENEIQNSK